MPELPKAQRFILYALGRCYSLLNSKFQDKPLSVTVSKGAFIDMLLRAKSVAKQPRALYKNMEDLEKNKYIQYIWHTCD